MLARHIYYLYLFPNQKTLFQTFVNLNDVIPFLSLFFEYIHYILCKFYLFLYEVMALVEYSSSEDEKESELGCSSVLPSFSFDIKEDTVRFSGSGKMSSSDGRARRFAHKHGNWATCVFIPGDYL